MTIYVIEVYDAKLILQIQLDSNKYYIMLLNNIKRCLKNLTTD